MDWITCATLACLIVAALICYSHLRYYEGKIAGFDEAVKICRKYHGVG